MTPNKYCNPPILGMENSNMMISSDLALPFEQETLYPLYIMEIVIVTCVWFGFWNMITHKKIWAPVRFFDGYRPVELCHLEN